MARTLLRMHLSDYLRPENGDRITASAFAERVGVSHTTVLRWANGTIKPTGDALKAIHEATDGLVTPNDMLGVAA